MAGIGEVEVCTNRPAQDPLGGPAVDSHLEGVFLNPLREALLIHVACLVVDEDPGAVRPLQEPVDEPGKDHAADPGPERHLAEIALCALHHRRPEELLVEPGILPGQPDVVNPVAPEHHLRVAALEDLVNDQAPEPCIVLHLLLPAEVPLDLADRVDPLSFLR